MKRKIAKLFVVLLPFIDLLTAIITRNTSTFITPGIILKGIVTILIFFYILFSKSKYKKISIISLISIIIYILLYFIFKIELLDMKYLLTEFTYLFKLAYFPVIFLGMLCYIDEYKIPKEYILNILKYTLIVYVILLFVPYVFNIAYKTYPNELLGFIGLFYAGNEIANIMILLLPMMYLLLNNKYMIIFDIIAIYITLIIGTKVATLGCLIVTFISFIYILFNKNKQQKVLSSVLLIITIVLSIDSYAINNYNYTLEMKENGVNISSAEDIIIDFDKENEVNEIVSSIRKKYDNKVILSALLSSRDIYLANTLSIYNDNIINNNLLFGIAFSNTKKVNNTNISKLIEIDLIDGYFHYGIIGLIIALIPLLITLLIVLKKKINIKSSYYILIVLLTCFISCLSGHVFFAPSVSIYFAMYLLLIIYELNGIDKKIYKNKISILSLHMGYGGIERSIINQANMLSTKYDVEIISLYKLIDKIPYKLNKNVKLIYLSDLKPNKTEFMNALRDKKIISLIREGILSIKILYLKKRLMTQYIINTDSKILISTRYEFSKLLNDYGNDHIKIVEEHVYHNNDKQYINKIKSLVNIDYLIPPSKYLYDEYKKILKINIKYIPQTIENVNAYNKTYNNTLIAVGRFEKEKAFDDLIDIFKLVHDKNKSAKLILIGDGSMKNDIVTKINKYNLGNNIIMPGFLNSNELYKYYRKSSIYIMTSLYESFGLTMLEAMSNYVPCIAFDTILSANEIIDGCGYIVKERDKSTMSKIILDLLDNTKLLEIMGNNSYEKSKKYMIKSVTNNWINFIDEIWRE